MYKRQVLADAREHGAGRRYLIEHSAGSGKTETISWAAHDLARLRRADGEKMFSSVVVVTDRLSLDQNIKKTISQLSKVTGQMCIRDRRWGVVGAGVATVAAEGISALLCARHIYRKIPLLHLGLRELKIDRRLLGETRCV